MRNKTELVSVIKESVAEPYRKHLLNNIRCSIRLKTIGKLNLELGKTKLGGCPDFPEDISWITSKYDNTFLSFLGQVNIKEFNE